MWCLFIYKSCLWLPVSCNPVTLVTMFYSTIRKYFLQYKVIFFYYSIIPLIINGNFKAATIYFGIEKYNFPPSTTYWLTHVSPKLKMSTIKLLIDCNLFHLSICLLLSLYFSGHRVILNFNTWWNVSTLSILLPTISKLIFHLFFQTNIKMILSSSQTILQVH